VRIVGVNKIFYHRRCIHELISETLAWIENLRALEIGITELHSVHFSL
jgi:hypothetical protein